MRILGCQTRSPCQTTRHPQPTPPPARKAPAPARNPTPARARKAPAPARNPARKSPRVRKQGQAPARKPTQAPPPRRSMDRSRSPDRQRSSPRSPNRPPSPREPPRRVIAAGVCGPRPRWSASWPERRLGARRARAWRRATRARRETSFPAWLAGDRLDVEARGPAPGRADRRGLDLLRRQSEGDLRRIRPVGHMGAHTAPLSRARRDRPAAGAAPARACPQAHSHHRLIHRHRIFIYIQRSLVHLGRCFANVRRWPLHISRCLTHVCGHLSHLRRAHIRERLPSPAPAPSTSRPRCC